MNLPASVVAPRPLSATQVDAHVGLRMRMRRKAIEVTQQSLAEALGVTFQQVQKYEQGLSRMSAGTLWAAAGALKVPVAYFFEGLGGDLPGVSEDDLQAVYGFLMASEGLDVVRAFLAIKSPRLRRRMLELMRDLSHVVDAKPATETITVAAT